MACRIEESTHFGSQSIELTNGLIRVLILPSFGGRVWELEDVRRGRQWIWHNPSVSPQPLPWAADYDSNWAGGWEELFPNDSAVVHEGFSLPDHGEWWNLPWNSTIENESAERVVIRMTRGGVTTPTLWQKSIEVVAGRPSVNIHYQIENTGTTALSVLFKQHLPVEIDHRHRVELPGGTVVPVDLGFSGRIGADGTYQWPNAAGPAGRTVDLSVPPPPTETTQEFVYVRDLPEPWCGVLDEATGARLRLHFDAAQFRYVWLFMSFGGWQGIRTVVLEPCTNMPKDLALAKQLGQCATIPAGSTLTTSVSAHLS